MALDAQNCLGTKLTSLRDPVSRSYWCELRPCGCNIVQFLISTVSERRGQYLGHGKTGSAKICQNLKWRRRSLPRHLLFWGCSGGFGNNNFESYAHMTGARTAAQTVGIKEFGRFAHMARGKITARIVAVSYVKLLVAPSTRLNYAVLNPSNGT